MAKVEEQWATFTKKTCQQYMNCILVKINAVIKAKGHNTKY